MSMFDEWDPRDVDLVAGVTPPEHFQGVEALVAFLASEPGQRALAWLRSLTVERTVSATVTPANALWHLEGQRALVLALQARVQRFVDGRH